MHGQMQYAPFSPSAAALSTHNCMPGHFPSQQAGVNGHGQSFVPFHIVGSGSSSQPNPHSTAAISSSASSHFTIVPAANSNSNAVPLPQVQVPTTSTSSPEYGHLQGSFTGTPPQDVSMLYNAVICAMNSFTDLGKQICTKLDDVARQVAAIGPAIEASRQRDAENLSSVQQANSLVTAGLDVLLETCNQVSEMIASLSMCHSFSLLKYPLLYRCALLEIS